MLKNSLIVLTLLFASFSAQAQQTLKLTVFMDQRDQPQALDAETKLVIFSSTKETGNWVKNSFESMGIEDLAAKKWLYVADVSGMPSLITKYMAIPKMQDYAFSIALERDGEVTADWPKQADAVNVYQLNALTIDKSYAFDSEEALLQFLNSIP